MELHGIVIAVLTVVVPGVALLWRWCAFRRAWADNVVVRASGDVDATVASDVLYTLRAWRNGADFVVELVDRGFVRGVGMPPVGSQANAAFAGSSRRERMFGFFGPSVWVASVVWEPDDPDYAAHTVMHEFMFHIFPHQTGMGWNANHSVPPLQDPLATILLYQGLRSQREEW